MTFKLRQHQKDMLMAMDEHDNGIIQCPTGGGKTFTFIVHSRQFMEPHKVIVVVAPQLLLLQQLFGEFDKHLNDINFVWQAVSSDQTKLQRDRSRLKFRIGFAVNMSTTIPSDLHDIYLTAVKLKKPLILFTTYKSLDRIVKSKLPITVAYYDEAHHATADDNFKKVKEMTKVSSRNYFFTATPKFSQGHANDGAGMDNVDVYGQFLHKVDFNLLIKQGVIVKPSLHLMKSNIDCTSKKEEYVNLRVIKDVVDYYENNHSETDNHKILFCTQGTKAIKNLLLNGLVDEMNKRGYHVLCIDSKNKGSINHSKKINKKKFIEMLNTIGGDAHEKMIVLHYNMIGEGIDIKNFTGVVFLRNNMNKIFAAQSIGRVIRAAPGKKTGNVTIIEHESDSGESKNIIKHVVHSLLSYGVPPETFIIGEDGRGEQLEEIDELDKCESIAHDVAVQWQHTLLLDDTLNGDCPDWDT